MKRKSILLAAGSIVLGSLLGMAWIASRPNPLPHRFLDGAEVLQREGWVELGGTRYKDNGTYRLSQPIAATEAAVRAELTDPGWTVVQKPKSVLISRDQMYITLMDRGTETTVFVQHYRPINFNDRLRQIWRKWFR